MYDRYNDLGSKSVYSGYDGGVRGGGPGTTGSDYDRAANLRRSRSIHAKFPNGGGGGVNGAGAAAAASRRNPYDFLPDEPGKVDPMKGGSPRYSDNYCNEKIDGGRGGGGYGDPQMEREGLYATRTKSGKDAQSLKMYTYIR